MENDRSGQDTAAVESISMLDYLSIVLKWRKQIILLTLAAAVVSIAVSFIVPKWYRATATILPPKDKGLFGQMAGIGSILKDLSPIQKVGSLGQNSGVYNYMAILKSRSTMESVVRKFDLMTVYEIKDSLMEDALKELDDNTTIKVEDEDYISIAVLDKSPQRAADMANYFAEMLNVISTRLGTQEGRTNREFIEKRLDAIRDRLRTAEDSLRRYQESSGTMIVPDPSTSSLSSIAELYALKSRKEIELAILSRTVSSDNPLLEQKRIELQEIEKKIGALPSVGLRSLRLYREVLIQQKIVEFLTPLYEQAKIEEQKDTPAILVLDKATPPEKKAKPKRALLVGLSTGGTFLLTLLLVFLYESLVRSGTLEDMRRAIGKRSGGTVRD